MIPISEDKDTLIHDILTLQREELETCDDLRALYISMLNHRDRHNDHSCTEKGVDIRVGDICYIDFGNAFIEEIGFQHFGLILSLYKNKAYVVPMSGNERAYAQAYSKDTPNGKRHLMRLEKVGRMKKRSVLFMNDSKWINTARVIDVKGHLKRESQVFQEIMTRVKDMIS
ncbi:hypothetical protein MKC73_01040 [[Clostridium] innocuum]|nr:hypothetical protein [[Clostridium] innocuum]